MCIRGSGRESPETSAANLRRHRVRNVVVEIIVDSGHGLADEPPARVAALIVRPAATREPR
jgi:pimeloyl-ACP methyl ester carboxylesterase